MSKRLILGFVLVSLGISVGMGLLRAYTLTGDIRQRESEHLTQQLAVVGAALQEGLSDDETIERSSLRPYVDPDGSLTYRVEGRDPVVVDGADFDAADGADAVRMSRPMDPGTLVMAQKDQAWTGLLGYQTGSLVTLILLVVLVSGIAGYLMSRWFSRPFTQLAAAAAMLGRGRFDLDLPTTRIPEVQAVSAALGASASALRDRLSREQQFSVHASHVLRTPLTSLRLHLDELDAAALDPQARRAAQRCLVSVEELDQVASDLVDITRRGALMAGAEIPLRELATAAAQQWADVLIGRGHGFSAAVEGDLDLSLTPGPIEYVLDVLLEQTQEQRVPEVRLVLVGAPEVVRLDVIGVDTSHARSVDDADALPSLTRADQARSLVESLGGRWQQLPDGSGTRVLMPPR